MLINKFNSILKEKNHHNQVGFISVRQRQLNIRKPIKTCVRAPGQNFKRKHDYLKSAK